jgi:hypothetical protein
MSIETTASGGAAAAGRSIDTSGTSQPVDARRAASLLRAVLHRAHGAVNWWRNDPMTARFDAERRRHGIS